jgi:hypothetical protein
MLSRVAGLCLIALAGFLFADPVAAAAADPAGYQFPGDGTQTSTRAMAAVPTFNSVSLYWRAEFGSAERAALVRYRQTGTAEWRQAHPLWFDDRNQPAVPDRNQEYRGSIVLLEPGTEYEIEAFVSQVGEVARATVKTWSEDFPIAKTVTLPTTSATMLTIAESGTPAGYILYTAPSGGSSEIDVDGAEDYDVHVKGSYVIVRGLTLKGARKHGIYLEGDVHDVVIEDNDISGWGRVADDGYGVNMDSAVRGATKKAAAQKRFVIQRNRLHHPRSGANSWMEPRGEKNNRHPKGPQAISLFDTGGNHVIRHNEIFSEPGHYFNDGMGSYHNFGYAGFPGPDSDIHGNTISQVWDDAIESEGANQNVRIWGNYTDQVFTALGVSATAVGPLYIFRNVTDRGQYTQERDMNSGVFIKAQSKAVKGTFYGGGRVYVYHNTLYRRSRSEGVRLGITPSGKRLLNYVSRNNILDNTEGAIVDPKQDPTNSLDFDLYQGRVSAGARRYEENGTKAKPVYDPASPSGRYTLSDGSAGHDAGVPIPNFSDGYVGKAPDCGAQERGASPLEFGRP